MPAAVQRSAISPELRLYVALGAADDLDHRLARVGALERALQVAGDAEAGERERLFHALSEGAGGAGIGMVELAGERLALVERTSMILARPGSAQPLLHRGPLPLGEMVEDVALLVPRASLDGCVAEDGADRLAQRLRAVDDKQDPLLGVEAALDQVGQKRRGHSGILRASFPEPERDVSALGRDSERDHVRALAEVDPVDHQHRQAHVVEAATH